MVSWKYLLMTPEAWWWSFCGVKGGMVPRSFGSMEDSKAWSQWQFPKCLHICFFPPLNQIFLFPKDCMWRAEVSTTSHIIRRHYSWIWSLKQHFYGLIVNEPMDFLFVFCLWVCESVTNEPAFGLKEKKKKIFFFLFSLSLFLQLNRVLGKVRTFSPLPLHNQSIKEGVANFSHLPYLSSVYWS